MLPSADSPAAKWLNEPSGALHVDRVVRDYLHIRTGMLAAATEFWNPNKGVMELPAAPGAFESVVFSQYASAPAGVYHDARVFWSISPHILSIPLPASSRAAARDVPAVRICLYGDGMTYEFRNKLIERLSGIGIGRPVGNPEGLAGMSYPEFYDELRVSFGLDVGDEHVEHVSDVTYNNTCGNDGIDYPALAIDWPMYAQPRNPIVAPVLPARLSADPLPHPLPTFWPTLDSIVEPNIYGPNPSPLAAVAP
jgi:hypothetical protein